MPLPRRSFFHYLGAAIGATALSQLLPGAELGKLRVSLADMTHPDLETAAADEAFWAQVRAAYTASTNLINLNNGGVSPQPRVVQEKVADYHRFANEAPGYYMWRVMGRMREPTRRQLGRLVGADPETVALLRNATEALETVIFGLDLNAGDEIITTDQDYPAILDALAARARRHGIEVRRLSLPVPCEDPAEITRRFAAAITPRTRALLFCHVINMSGQILPVRELCELARNRGLYSIVDGAHAIGQLELNLEELGCDFYGASLHKWLSAPFGTGMLYVRRPLIPKLWPLYGYPEAEQDSITKFEHLGTRSVPMEIAISDAIDFHDLIGTARKGARLQYLKRYWVEQVRDTPGFHLYSSLDPAHGAGLTTFSLDGWTPAELSSALTNQYHLYVTAFDHRDVAGVRITPHVYTRLEDLDYLAETIRKLAQEGPGR
ncbi:MAG: aminotransferase class V-fold PLP-dependent enzyme [Bacteroidetes bacterium]|nr:MAG: aminotransferase class V-fold PLP-dependent enzyme [Bacteroidota bacterium]